MLKIYLDQKDYSRIAQARSGKGDDAPEARIAEYLRALVAQGHVRIYYSWVHVLETLRFRDDRLPAVQAYCLVVDQLTQGHCLRYPSHLLRAELDLALAERFGFSPEVPSASYAYGQHYEAVNFSVPDVDLVDLMADQVAPDQLGDQPELGALLRTVDRSQLRALILNAPDALLAEFTRHVPLRSVDIRQFLAAFLAGSRDEQRDAMRHVLKDRAFLREAVRQFPDEFIRQLRARFPATGFEWTLDLVETALLGSQEERRALWTDYFRGVFTFEPLITFYSVAFSDIRRLGFHFDPVGKTLVDQMERLQRLEAARSAVFQTPATWDQTIARQVAGRFMENLQPDVEALAAQHGFPSAPAMKFLQREGLVRLPYIGALVAALQSYLAHHKGRPPRTPSESDLRDLLHLAYAPYVDLYVADRFSAEVARAVSRSFQVCVLRSLSELREELEQRL